MKCALFLFFFHFVCFSDGNFAYFSYLHKKFSEGIVVFGVSQT